MTKSSGSHSAKGLPSPGVRICTLGCVCRAGNAGGSDNWGNHLVYEQMIDEKKESTSPASCERSQMQCLNLLIFFGEKDEERTLQIKWVSLWPFLRKVKRKTQENENLSISAKTQENKNSEDGEERPHT